MNVLLATLFDNWVLAAIVALGTLVYFLLIRSWLELRARAASANQAHTWLRCLPAMITALPLLGLLGTIIGLLHTFRVMALPVTVGGALLTDGIAAALLTTQYGLAFAVPAWLLLAWLNRHPASYPAVHEVP